MWCQSSHKMWVECDISSTTLRHDSRIGLLHLKFTDFIHISHFPNFHSKYPAFFMENLLFRPYFWKPVFHTLTDKKLSAPPPPPAFACPARAGGWLLDQVDTGTLNQWKKWYKRPNPSLPLLDTGKDFSRNWMLLVSVNLIESVWLNVYLWNILILMELTFNYGGPILTQLLFFLRYTVKTELKCGCWSRLVLRLFWVVLIHFALQGSIIHLL